MIRKMIVSLRDYYLVNVKWKKYTFGNNFHAGKNVIMWAKSHIVIGDNCYIGRNSQIECNATIGNDVLIANNVAFVGRYDHHYKQIGVSIRKSSQIRQSDYDWLELDKEVHVGDDVWVGYGAIVLSGLKIANGCIISAGSVLTKSTEPYTIYAGVPAKPVAQRFDSIDDLAEHIKQLNINTEEKNENNGL